MKTNHGLRRRVCTAIFMIVAAFVTGCGPEDEGVNPVCSHLPVPAIPWVDGGPLNSEAALRKCEAEHRVAQSYLAQGYRLLATTQNYSGQIIDWMAADSVPGSDKQPPPPIDLSDLNLPPGVQLGKTELQMYPELQGPLDTVAVPRMMFSRYVSGETGARSLDEFVEQFELQSGAPDGQDRLYAGYKLHMHNKGNVTLVNAFSGPPIEYETLSLMEMAVGCHDKDNPDATLQLIGIAASRDNWNFNYYDEGARELKLQVEFLTAGVTAVGIDPKTGKGRGGWHGSLKSNTPGFVVKSPTTVAYPGVLMQASTVDGPQYEHRFEIQLFNGDWWLALNGEWFGWYPASNFTLMRDYACDLYWYTEVFDGTPYFWTYTDAGSGEFAAAGAKKSAYFRRMFYMDEFGYTHWLLPDTAKPVSPQNPNCYTTGPLAVTQYVGYENWCYCGGPGNDLVKAPFCKSFSGL